MAMETGTGHQEEISELKQRPWLGVGNGGNAPRDRSPKTKKRTMMGYRLECTFNSLEEEIP